ncbi:cilia- and flagella-associated protein 69 isoform X2 [Amia ocellicauda]|uniref:cilia- and flagella-associated protein 69 isoform X2 n=1 Tax=Amia ocellicauda TaxID=2972642 RepID=UPI003464258A
MSGPEVATKHSEGPVFRHTVTDSDLGMREHAALKPIDLSRIINLLEDPLASSLKERHLSVLKKVVKRNQNGFLLKDLVQIFKILNLCAEKAREHPEYTLVICDLLKICSLPFLKEKSSDESSYAQIVKECLSQMGYLMRVPSADVRLQVCDSIAAFYHPKAPRQQVEGLHPTSPSYKPQMAEESGVAETLVLSLALLEEQPAVRLQVLRALQLLSSASGLNCSLILRVRGASKICALMNEPDPSGRLLRRCTDVLGNLLELGSKEEATSQLSTTDCFMALKEAFVNLLLNGHRRSDLQLRNDLLLICTVVAGNPKAPLIESGFAKQLILFATFPEIKSHNPLVRNLKLSFSDEDFEMKKLLFNMLVVMSRDLSAVQLLQEGKVLLALLQHVRPGEAPRRGEWTAAQQEELQLQALATLVSLVPLLPQDYLTCQGSTRLLLLMDWCVSAGLLTKMEASSEEEDAVALEIKMDALLVLSTLCDNDAHRKELFGPEGVELLVRFLKMDPALFYSGLGHNKLILTTVDCIWSCVVGCYPTEDLFLEKGGVLLLLDLLQSSPRNMQDVVLGTLLELCDNSKTPAHISSWRGKKGETAAGLLVRLWRAQETELGVRRDASGRIVDVRRPLLSVAQEEEQVEPIPADQPSAAIMDVSENMRAKIYSVFCRLGFEDLPGLRTEDYVTIAVISRYLDFKVGEVWAEISRELEAEGVRPVSPDQEALQSIGRTAEEAARAVAALQTQLLGQQRQQELREEQQLYSEMRTNHKHQELAVKSWEAFVARTSNYTLLKDARRLQEKSIASSRPQKTDQDAVFHPTQIRAMHTTSFCGRSVQVESTPVQLTGGPLAGTDLALDRLSVRGGALRSTRPAQPPGSVPVQ